MLTQWSICVAAIAANTLVNMFNTRKIVICGGLISTAGFMLSAYATSVEFLYFSYGFLGGTRCYLRLLAASTDDNTRLVNTARQRERGIIEPNNNFTAMEMHSLKCL